jgi:hypothetical protein
MAVSTDIVFVKPDKIIEGFEIMLMAFRTAIAVNFKGNSGDIEYFKETFG